VCLNPRNVTLYDVENQSFRYGWRTYTGDVYYTIDLVEIELNSCKLSSDNYMSGIVNAEESGGTWSFDAVSGNNEVTYNYSGDNLPMGQTDTLSCIFATPIIHSNLVIEFTFTCKYIITGLYGAYVNGRLRQNITPQPSYIGDEIMSDEITNTLKTKRTFGENKKYIFYGLILPIV